MTQTGDVNKAMEQLLQLDRKLESAERDAKASERVIFPDESDTANNDRCKYSSGANKHQTDPTNESQKDQHCFVTETSEIRSSFLRAQNCCPIADNGECDSLRSFQPSGAIMNADIMSASACVSVQSSIARNKSLCSTMGGKHLLTVDEDERVSVILEQEEERFIFTNPQRELEVNEQLNRLGIQFDDEYELCSFNDQGASGGDPILRGLAEKRALDEKEHFIDMALRTLLRAPIQSNSQKDDQNREEDDLTTCSNKTRSSALTAEGLRLLVEEVKQDLDADGIKLAERDTIRSLFESVVGR